jgi:tetratricopeptide (TPR) repeat protein
MAETSLDPEALPSNKIMDARAALGEGNLPRAYALSRLALQADARNMDANAILADIQLQRRDYLGAFGYVVNLLDANPSDMVTRLRVALVTAGLGCFDMAATTLDNVSPGAKLAHDNVIRLVNHMIAAGRQQGHVGIQAIQTKPGQSINRYIKASLPTNQRIANLIGLILARRGDRNLWMLLGDLLHDNDKLLEAEAALWRVVALDPSDLRPYQSLAKLHKQVNENRLVTMIYEKGLENGTPTPDYVLQFGSFLTNEGKLRWPKAEKLYSDYFEIGKDNPWYLIAYANAKDNVGDYDAARDLAGAAMANSGNDLASVFSIFRYAIAADNTELAQDCVRKAGEIRPNSPIIQSMEGLLASAANEHEAAVEKLEPQLELAAKKIGPDVLATSLFALGRSADKLKKHELAYRAFKTANDVRTAQHNVDEESKARFISQCNEIEAHFRDGTKDHSSPVKPEGGTRHGIICGLPRSGTTLLDTFLRAHSQLSLLEEEPFLNRAITGCVRDRGGWKNLRPITQEQGSEARERYLEDVRSLSREAVQTDYIVDRHPFNTPVIGAIQQVFPEAPVVFIARHPLDVVFSIFMQDFQLADALSNGLTLEGSARFYDAMMRAFVAGASAMKTDVLFIRYEDLVADPETTLRSVTDHLGVAWEDGILDHQKTAEARGRIRTASHSQVRQPLFKSARYRWKNYTFALDEHRPAVEHWIDYLGYSDVG